MKPDTANLDLERILAILRRRAWVIAFVTLLVAGASYGFSRLQRKEYTATASVLLLANPQVDPQTGLPVTAASTTVDPTVQATAIQVLSHQPGVTQATARIVGHGLTPVSVAHAISVSQEGQTNVADVSATSRTASLASTIANTFVNHYISGQRSQARAALGQGLRLVEAQIAGLSPEELAGPNGQALLDRAEALRIAIRLQNGGVQLLTRAQRPSSPSSPKVTRNTALGLVLGLLLGFGVAFVLERFDRRIKDVEELETTYERPLLAAVPHDESYVTPPRLTSVPRRGDKEVFRLLRAYLRYFDVDRELRLLMVASAAPGDGKTTIAHNLAEASQEAGTKTLLVEADLRHSNLARYYGLRSAPGLSEFLSGRVQLGEAIQSIPIAPRVNGASSQVSLDVLVGGHPPPNPAELIESHAMAELLVWAAGEYELVVIDTPPLALVSDAMPLLPKVDGVVLVSQLGKHTRDNAAFLRERLFGVSAPLLGVVANNLRLKGKGKYGYGYGYGYYGANYDGSETRNGLRAPAPVD